jgi:hypothetical protein
MFTCMATIRVRTREGHTHTIEVAGDEETASHATTLIPYDEIIEVTILHP